MEYWSGPGKKKSPCIVRIVSFCHVVRLKMSFHETEESVDLVHEVFQYLKDSRYPDGSIIALHMYCEISVSALQKNLVCKQLTLI